MIVAFVPDLMDRSRFGPEVRFVSRPDQVGEATTVVVDLTKTSPTEWVGLPGQPHLIGFGPHVDDKRLEAARVAGFDEVLARSVMFRRVHELGTT